MILNLLAPWFVNFVVKVQFPFLQYKMHTRKEDVEFKLNETMKLPDFFLQVKY